MPENEEKLKDNSEKENILEETDLIEEIEEKTVKEETVEEQSENYESQFGELEDFTEDDNKNDDIETKTKIGKKSINKKKVRIISVIVAVIVIVLAVGVYFVFFNKSPKGIWVYEGNTEEGAVNVYYNFSDNSLETVSGDEYVTRKATYYNINYDKNSFNLNLSEENVSKIVYNISGNMIKGRTLSFYFESSPDQKTELKSINSMDDVPTELKGPEFVKNDEIIGVWRNTSKSGILEFIVFDDKGYMTQSQIISNTYSTEATQRYTFDGKKVNMKYNESEYDTPAYIKDGKFYITSYSPYTYEEITLEYEKISEDEYNSIKKDLENGGPIEIPTDDLVVHSSEEATSNTKSEAVTEATTVK